MQTPDIVQHLPLYRDIAAYRAAKITQIGAVRRTGCKIHLDGLPEELDNGVGLHVSAEWMERHEPREGGYLVIDADLNATYVDGALFEARFAPQSDGTACTEGFESEPEDVAQAQEFVEAVDKASDDLQTDGLPPALQQKIAVHEKRGEDASD